MSETSGLILFDFLRLEDAKSWRSIDDTVMGGVSSSQFRVPKKGVAVFSGVVSLENNGGFASARSQPRQFDLHNCKGIAIRVKGDGKRYKLSLRTDTSFDGISYQLHFQPKKGEWSVIHLPFKRFAPMYHGRLLTDVPPLEPQNIRTVGFLISEKQQGPFRLEIDWIKAYKSDETRPS